MEPMIWAGIVIAILIAYAVFQVVRMKREFEGKGGSYENITSWLKSFLPEMLR